MLTDLLFSLPIRVRHWLLRLTGTYDGMHDWCPGFCPCGGEHQ